MPDDPVLAAPIGHASSRLRGGSRRARGEPAIDPGEPAGGVGRRVRPVGGFDFVDVRTPFHTHRICDDVEWLNGLSNPVGESYHPDRLGHDTFTDLVSARL